MDIVRASCALAFAAVLVASCSPAPATPVETLVEEFDLDLASGDGGSPMATGPVLEAGRAYTVEIQGTFSIWGESGWQGGSACLGEPEPAPMYPSPGGQNVWVGLDAEFWFAVAPISSLCGTWSDEDVPNHTGRVRFSVDGGTDFDHVEPIGGEPAQPDPEHRYRYGVVGQGQRLMVERDDTSTSDDYGVLKVRVYRSE